MHNEDCGKRKQAAIRYSSSFFAVTLLYTFDALSQPSTFTLEYKLGFLFSAASLVIIYLCSSVKQSLPNEWNFQKFVYVFARELREVEDHVYLILSSSHFT